MDRAALASNFGFRYLFESYNLPDMNNIDSEKTAVGV